VCQKQHWEIHKTECQVKKQLGAAIGLVPTTSSDKFEILRFVRMSGELNEHNGNFAAAELMYTTVLEDRKKLLGEFHFDTLESMNDLGYLSQQQGQIAKAKSLYEDCLKKCREVNDSRTLLTVMNNLANLYIGLGKDDEGKVLLFECLDKAKANIGTPGNRTLVLLTLEQLAGFYIKREQWASCEPFQVEFMEMKKAELGKDDPEVIKAMGCVACTYALQGKNAFAEPLYIEAHGRRRATLGEDHPLTLESLNSLASFYFSVGKFALSKTILIECLEKSKKALGPKHPFSKKLKRNLKAFPTGY
jgi:tetratricopeptide (TPR) repeat protein